MRTAVEQLSYPETDQLRLFKSFVESIKLPLLQMARSAELSTQTGDLEPLKTVSLAADTLNRLIDNYALSLELQTDAGQIGLVPVSIGAALNDAAHIIESQAHKYGCDLELHLNGRYAPVLAHPMALQAALVSMAQVLIDAQSQRATVKRQVIKLAAHKTRYGIVAGMFTDIEGLSAATIKRAKHLYGNAKQPLSQLTSAAGAEVFVANALLESMTSGLRAAKFQKLSGLAATFTPSQQMALV